MTARTQPPLVPRPLARRAFLSAAAVADGALAVACADRAMGGPVLSAPRPPRLRVRQRGVGPGQILRVTLMEDDGTSWSAAVAVDSTWREQSLPLAAPLRSDVASCFQRGSRASGPTTGWDRRLVGAAPKAAAA
jgi:hypothetical protein